MPQDPYSYVAPSRVKTLLCPVGKIRRSLFFQYADRLSNTFEVRLVDVTPDGRSDRAMFSPLGYPNGKVIYDFSLSAPYYEEEFALTDLEPYRQTFVIIGLASFKTSEGQQPGEAEIKELKKKFPGAIVHKIILFGVSDESFVTKSKHVLPVQSHRASSFTSLETVMCDITSEFLAELAIFTISRQLASFKSPAVKDMDAFEPHFESSVRKPDRLHKSRSHLSASLTKSGSISLGMTDRAKSKQSGRRHKFTGNMYLLAGHLPDALRELSEAASLFKQSYDHIWHASSLDAIGVCLVLMSFLEVPVTIPQVALDVAVRAGIFHAEPHSPRTMTPPISEDTSRMAALAAIASASSNGTSSSQKSASPHPTAAVAGSPTSLMDFLPDLVEGVLRYYSRGQDTEEVPEIVYAETLLRFLKLLVLLRLGGGWNGASLSAIVRGTSLHKNISKESPSKQVLSSWANKLHTPELDQLALGEKCRIFSGLASVYEAADMPRKHAFVLRELLVMLNNETLRRQKENENHSDPEISKTNGGYLGIWDSSTENGLLEQLDSLCKIYGAGDIRMAGCGWTILKVSFIRTAIRSCEITEDNNGLVHYISMLFSIAADMLIKEEQLKLYTMMRRAVDIERQSGNGGLLADYFDPYLLRSIRRADDTSSNRLMEKKVDNLENEKDDVFLYNPYANREKQEQDPDLLLIQNERSNFLVKLQNPFEFEVHLAEVQLLTDDEAGQDIDCSISNIYLSPTSVTEILIPAIPQKTGKLKILGVKARASNCRMRSYYLKRHLSPKLETKIKCTGISSGSMNEIDGTKLAYTLDYEVLPEQPIISLKQLSLNEKWVPLFEGETQDLTIHLSNLSEVPTNYLKFSFYDSTTDSLQDIMNRRGLADNERYECEYFLYKRRALELIQSVKEIGPSETCESKIKVLGKSGLTNGFIHVDYGHIPENSQSSKSVWTKRLTIPLHFTVNPTIELASCSIISVQKQLNFGSSPLSAFLNQIEDKSMEQYHILVLDFRNSWSEAVTMDIWSKDPDDEQPLMRVTETVNPSCTKRILLPIKWNGINVSGTDEPIPNLSGRQFIVNSAMPKDLIKQMKEMFWYREKLLELLEGEWRLSENDSRYGKVEIRGLRMTQSMVAALRTEEIRISMDIVEKSKKPVCNKTDNGTWLIPAEFDGTALRTVLTNTSDRPIAGILRLIPSSRYGNQADDVGIGRRLLYNGWLQRPIKQFEPGESVTVDLGVVYIAKGEYQWSSVFDTIKNGKQLHGQKATVFVKVA